MWYLITGYVCMSLGMVVGMVVFGLLGMNKRGRQ